MTTGNFMGEVVAEEGTLRCGSDSRRLKVQKPRMAPRFLALQVKSERQGGWKTGDQRASKVSFSGSEQMERDQRESQGRH